MTRSMAHEVAQHTGIAQALESLLVNGMPCRLTAYDGSEAGNPDSPIHLDLATPRGLTYLLTAPGDLGFARAYIAGDLVLRGAHPGDPYDAMTHMLSRLRLRTPTLGELPELARVFSGSLGLRGLVPPEPPPQEVLPPWRRALEGMRHSRSRDSVTPSARTPYSRAAWRTMPPQPQPTSSSRIPSRSPSFRATRSYFSACASSSVESGVGYTAQV